MTLWIKATELSLQWSGMLKHLEGLREEPLLLLRIQKSNLRWFGYLIQHCLDASVWRYSLWKDPGAVP